MSFSLISDAAAQTAAPASNAAAQTGSSMTSLIFIVVMIAVMYFIMIRPQQKRQKELQNLINNLQKGDEVVTTGGLIGKIVKLDETIVTLSINETTEVKVQRNAIIGLLPKGSMK